MKQFEATVAVSWNYINKSAVKRKISVKICVQTEERPKSAPVSIMETSGAHEFSGGGFWTALVSAE